MKRFTFQAIVTVLCATLFVSTSIGSPFQLSSVSSPPPGSIVIEASTKEVKAFILALIEKEKNAPHLPFNLGNMKIFHFAGEGFPKDYQLSSPAQVNQELATYTHLSAEQRSADILI